MEFLGYHTSLRGVFQVGKVGEFDKLSGEVRDYQGILQMGHFTGEEQNVFSPTCFTPIALDGGFQLFFVFLSTASPAVAETRRFTPVELKTNIYKPGRKNTFRSWKRSDQ